MQHSGISSTATPAALASNRPPTGHQQVTNRPPLLAPTRIFALKPSDSYWLAPWLLLLTAPWYFHRPLVYYPHHGSPREGSQTEGKDEGASTPVQCYRPSYRQVEAALCSAGRLGLHLLWTAPTCTACSDLSPTCREVTDWPAKAGRRGR